MIERIDAPAGVVAFEAVGKIEASDYDDLRPVFEAAIAERGAVRMVIVLGPGYEGFTAGAAMEDAKLWGPNLTHWERCGVVTDHRFLAETMKVFAVIMPGELKVFPVDELDAALAWAAADR